MKTTVELPDDLFRRAKAVAALRGRKFKDLVEEGLRRVVESPENKPESEARRDLLRKYCGIVDSGVTDLSTNPRHMEGFGQDNRRDR